MLIRCLLLSICLLGVACQSEKPNPTRPSSSSDSSSTPLDTLIDSAALPSWPINYHFKKILPWQADSYLYVAGYGTDYPHYLLFFEKSDSALRRFHTGALIGQLQQVELVDFEGDGQPELLLHSARKGQAALALIALQADGQKLGEWQLPYLDRAQEAVFDGRGYFSVRDSLLLHHFASTANGDSLHLRYRYRQGELQILDYIREEESEK